MYSGIEPVELTNIRRQNPALAKSQASASGLSNISSL